MPETLKKAIHEKDIKKVMNFAAFTLHSNFACSSVLLGKVGTITNVGSPTATKTRHEFLRDFVATCCHQEAWGVCPSATQHSIVEMKHKQMYNYGGMIVQLRNDQPKEKKYFEELGFEFVGPLGIPGYEAKSLYIGVGSTLVAIPKALDLYAKSCKEKYEKKTKKEKESVE